MNRRIWSTEQNTGIVLKFIKGDEWTAAKATSFSRILGYVQHTIKGEVRNAQSAQIPSSDLSLPPKLSGRQFPLAHCYGHGRYYKGNQGSH